MAVVPREIALTSVDLADWVDQQDPDSWWILGQEPLLWKKLNTPCSGWALSQHLRKLDAPMFLLDFVRDQPQRDRLTSEEIGDYAKVYPRHGEQELHFRWAHRSPEQRWYLMENKEFLPFLRESNYSKVIARGGIW